MYVCIYIYIYTCIGFYSIYAFRYFSKSRLLPRAVCRPIWSRPAWSESLPDPRQYFDSIPVTSIFIPAFAKRTPTLKHASKASYIHVCICMCIYIYICTCISVDMYIYIYIYTCTYACILNTRPRLHLQTWPRRPDVRRQAFIYTSLSLYIYIYI